MAESVTAADVRAGASDGRAAALVAFGAALLALRAIYAGAIPLADDEAYYRLWALQPSLSYYDHPPMVAWFIAAGRALGGDAFIAVRLAGVVASAIGAIAVWRTAYVLYGRETGRLAFVFALSMPLLNVGGVIITPDTPSVLFYLLGMWALAELQADGNANWWFAVGLLAGLGLLSKYTNLFFGATILVWLLALPQNRRWFASWQLYAGGLIAALLSLPVIIWNAQHGWISFAKQFGRVSAHKYIGPVAELEMAGALLLLASPIIFGLAVAGLLQSFRDVRRAGSQLGLLLLAATVPVFAYFAYHGLSGRVQPNWLSPIYPALAIAAAVAAIGPMGGLRWLRGAAVALGLFFTFAIFGHAMYPLVLGSGLKDPTHQLHGWRALSHEVEGLARKHGAGWVAAGSYATAAQLSLYLDQRIPVVQINERVRYTFLPSPPAEVMKQPALFIDLDRRYTAMDLGASFGSVTALGVLERRIGEVPVATYRAGLLADPRASPRPPGDKRGGLAR